MRKTRQNQSQEAIGLLEQKSKELKDLFDSKVFQSEIKYLYFRSWCSETEYHLGHIFGKDSREFKKFEDAVRLPFPVGTASQIAKQIPRDREMAMRKAAAEIHAILSAIKEHGISETQEAAVAPQIFIAHGGKTTARDKLEDFLMALGIVPIIVEDQPSEGRSKDKNVEYYLKQCDCAIILATKGDVDGHTGEFIPRGNILIEVGRSQELFPDRMIYLLEEGAKFPTDVDEKVWGRFTEESMDRAFIKVARELKAFGLIRAVRSRKANV